MAAEGATLDQLRDFCNRNGIPATRQQFWGHTTWNSLLHPHCLLQYAGYGVWNVRGKNQRHNPPSEWVVVDNAHSALITEEEAHAIIATRLAKREKRFDHGFHRSRKSSYLLSGGLIKCGRCGSNLLGLRKTETSDYYICGSQPHRRGLGCGPAVYVPKDEIESEVIAGITSLLSVCADPDGFTRKVNAEIRQIWEKSVGYDPSAVRKIADIDSKISNIRRSIENGMPDADWAYGRMRELMEERQKLESAPAVTGEAPQIDPKAAMEYRRTTNRILQEADPAEKKQLLRTWVDEITMAPDSLTVDIRYRIPEPLVNTVGADSVVIANYPPLKMYAVEVKHNRRHR